MRTAHILLLAIFVASASWASAALVHESTFNQTTGTDPVAAGDATHIWAVDGSWTGGVYGYYSYNGTGQLILHHPDHNWDDPYMEYDTSGIMNLSDDMEVVLDCQPTFGTTTSDQGIALMVTDPSTSATPSSIQSNVAAAEAILVVRSFNNIVRVAFSGDPSNMGGYASLPVTADQLTDLRMILTYDSTLHQYKAYVQANGGTLEELPTVVSAYRSKAVVNVTEQMVYTGELELAYDVNLDDLKIYNSIQTTSGSPLPLQEKIFNATPNPSDPFYPITVGDLNQMYKDNAQVYNYNGTGQLVVGHPATNTGWPNGTINLLTPTNAPITQIVIDVDPGFTNDGVLQMFNLWFGNDLGIFVANSQGTGGGVGIFAWQSNIYALNPSDAAVIPMAAADITSLRLVITHFAYQNKTTLMWSVNGGSLHTHPRSPQYTPRTFTSVEFQWQVWSASNPSPFTVALDNFAEYNQVLYGPPLTAASPSWDLYR